MTSFFSKTSIQFDASFYVKSNSFKLVTSGSQEYANLFET